MKVRTDQDGGKKIDKRNPMLKKLVKNIDILNDIFSEEYDLDKHELYYLKYHIDTLIDDIINIKYPKNKNEIKKINIIIKNFLERCN